jgi:hypothetical protein
VGLDRLVGDRGQRRGPVVVGAHERLAGEDAAGDRRHGERDRREPAREAVDAAARLGGGRPAAAASCSARTAARWRPAPSSAASLARSDSLRQSPDHRCLGLLIDR